MSVNIVEKSVASEKRNSHFLAENNFSYNSDILPKTPYTFKPKRQT
jgi:hypothetical protein